MSKIYISNLQSRKEYKRASKQSKIPSSKEHIKYKELLNDCNSGRNKGTTKTKPQSLDERKKAIQLSEEDKNAEQSPDDYINRNLKQIRPIKAENVNKLHLELLPT